MRGRSGSLAVQAGCLLLLAFGDAAVADAGTADSALPVASRTLPARDIPVPATVSPAMAEQIARPPMLPHAPGSTMEWNALVQSAAAMEMQRIAKVKQQFGVKVDSVSIAGVPCFRVTPSHQSERNWRRLLLHLHGGGYVFGPGESGTYEAIVMAGFSGMSVVSVDYRMPPAHPFPAAMDDAVAVWKELSKNGKAAAMAVFGSSTGGAMTLALVQRAQKEGLALPAAIAPGTPWSDLTKTGDSYFTNDGLDNAVVSYDPLLSAAARLYAGGVDLKDPRLSPVYGSFAGFPPTILTTGTRDLFLSNTVRVHSRLQQAGVDSVLEVYEGQSHGQYLGDPTAPEAKEAFENISRFLDAHLGT